MQEKSHFEEIIIKLKDNDPKLKELSLGNLVSNAEDLKALTEALSVNNTVEKILVKNLTLTAWTEAGAIALGTVLKTHRGLKALSIGSMLYTQTTKKIVSGLLLSLTGTAPIKSFSYEFESSKSSELIRTIGESLHENTTLEEIYLEDFAGDGLIKINPSDLELFIEGLLNKKTLSSLKLYGLVFEDLGIQLFSKKLTHQKSLQKLTLSKLYFSAASIPVLIPALALYCPNVEEIDLGANCLSTGENELARQLPFLKNLKSLCLASNSLTLDRAPNLIKLFKNPLCLVRELDLSSNNYNSNAIFELLKDLISDNKKLEALHLNFLGLDDIFVEEFGELLSNPKKCFLSQLTFADNVGLSQRSQNTLLSALIKNPNLCTILPPVAKIANLRKAMEINKAKKIKASQAEFIGTCIGFAQICYSQNALLPTEVIHLILFFVSIDTLGMSNSEASDCIILIESNFKERGKLQGKRSAEDWWKQSLMSGRTIFRTVTELKHVPEPLPEKKQDCTIM